MSGVEPFDYVTRKAMQAAAQCGCLTCLEAADPHFADFPTRMVLCATCGNKRCPHATDHANPCSGSNRVGQVGSAYGLFVRVLAADAGVDLTPEEASVLCQPPAVTIEGPEACQEPDAAAVERDALADLMAWMRWA